MSNETPGWRAAETEYTDEVIGDDTIPRLFEAADVTYGILFDDHPDKSAAPQVTAVAVGRERTCPPARREQERDRPQRSNGSFPSLAGEPLVGETVTVTTTVALSAGSPSAATVERVELVTISPVSAST